MTAEQLERDLSAWFAETAGRGTPDFAEDILLETSGIRQRPRWTFVPLLPRPMGRTLRWTLTGLAPGRRLALAAVVVGLLVLGAGTVWVASQPRLPPPFGPAANGLVAYEKSGDIFVVDPETGERSGLVLGPEYDRSPRWSLDGTQLAFLRGLGSDGRLVIVDGVGIVQAVSGGALQGVDPDTIAWAPDGRSVLLKAEFDRGAAFYLVDARTGRSTVLPITPRILEAYWRPPDGRELIFFGGSARSPELHRYSLADGAITHVPLTSDGGPAWVVESYRPVGWTADGSRFAFHRATDGNGRLETVVVDVETGDETILDVAFGRISNDGTRILGLALDGSGGLCVAPVDGGTCERIEGSVDLLDPTGWASTQWSPDDTSIRSRPGDVGPAVLLNPDGGEVQRPEWAAEGAESWQRRAP